MKKKAGILITNSLSILGLVISLFFKKEIVVGPEMQTCNMIIVAPIHLLFNIITTFVLLILSYHFLLKDKNTIDSKSDTDFILFYLNLINLFSVIFMIVWFWLYRI